MLIKRTKDTIIYVSYPTVVEGDPKSPFSIATTSRCRGRCDLFPWIAPLTFYLYLIMLSIKQGGIKYHFLSRLWIEPRSPGPLANTLPAIPIGQGFAIQFFSSFLVAKYYDATVVEDSLKTVQSLIGHCRGRGHKYILEFRIYSVLEEYFLMEAFITYVHYIMHERVVIHTSSTMTKDCWKDLD